MKCEYGCGNEALYQMTSGKWCCSSFYTMCPRNRKKNSDKNKGKNKTIEHKEKLSKARIGKTYEELMGLKKSIEQKELKREQGKLKIGSNNGMFGKKHTKESIEVVRLKNSGKNNYGWKGGMGTYLHQKAYELFGENKCERCNISSEEYSKNHKIKFDMHCTSYPKNYKIMEKSNWKCLCRACHKKEEDEQDSNS